MPVDTKMMEFYLKKILEHSDKMYNLVSDSNPEGKLFRPNGEEATEQDKRISSAVWHAHEINKYIYGAQYHINKSKENEA